MTCCSKCRGFLLVIGEDQSTITFECSTCSLEQSMRKDPKKFGMTPPPMKAGHQS